MREVTLTIDGQPVTVPEGTTLLKAAEALGISIPTICYHEACTANAICRMCVVEVEKQRLLQPACIVEARDGMVVHTHSERVVRSRRTILEMLDSAVDLSDAPEIQAQMAEYNVNHNRFPDAARRTLPVIDDNPMYIRDYARCILCWRCVQVCAEDAQYTFALSFDGRGFHTQIGTFFDLPMPETTCVFCGQCVGVCPTGALKPRREWLLEQGKTPDEILQMSRTERRKSRRVQRGSAHG
ncbi:MULTISPECIES: 2Fe-2S iron-sulfur cluster-binding protein [Caldilinea]|jgi:NADH dehydrogenase/NADH:ubiquinone oxidoreductase subunit G|uniref:Putative formate dehydrogenase iron-sulfur protein n=1 Tax=Caldilinea aerophila (strain DSM 14535 / JCM 11387 / NBRC 104270 / STL-6-O1) TaxID=926550 RepID=I0I045_CALAS|nr:MULTISPECIES: 2Fe-2S iron-sulfur cluster-binding protein [Caldilinea]MBO9393657.1 (2Fe-2S)-binding protein [Caldilinea sp.]BAL98632.1 putative formate dehydrogenase iron-sulfur protein [Caldilinea aerophila DSM 14535 = NBRC 104270]GIV74785.1 MAG: formate dehydrogenase subunit alpha [Caldilinea sp.]